MFGESHEVHADTAPHFKQVLPPVGAEVDGLREIAKSFGAARLNFRKELFASDRMFGILRIRNVLAPIASDLIN